MTKKIVVVGAGMAGIMAARTLQEAGYQATILEARDRIGGRTHTDHSLGISIDLGAAWIHGPIGNPLTPLQAQFNVGGTVQGFDPAADDYQIHGPDGAILDIDEFGHGELLFQAELNRQIGSQLTEPFPETLQSIQQQADYCFERVTDLTDTQQHGFIFAAITDPELWDAADADQIDRHLDETYLELPGGDVLLSGGGYNKITDGLANGLTIKTGVQVTAIHYDTTPLTVETNQGSYQADYAVVTVPLGVLQSQQIAFTPVLPEEKRTAINRIGFGFAEKLALRFDAYHWPKDKTGFVYCSENEKQYLSSWTTHGEAEALPILVSYKTGSHASDFNHWSDEESVERAMTVLQKMFGPMPAPTHYIRTNWMLDPFSQGSYSFEKVGQHPDDRATLAQPVADRLFFAGEATHTYYLGTVHGAYETGIRAAREVMAVMQGEG